MNNTTAVLEFATTNRCDADWIARMIELDLAPVVLSPGQKGTTSGFDAVVVDHYANGMYNVRVPGGAVCISGTDFIPA